jgi:hypothetical protein
MKTKDWERELDEWEEKYKPSKNPFNDEDKFETYGEQLEFVQSQNNNCVWTLLDGADGNLYIVSGYHTVNRLNYFVTEVPYEEEYLEVPYYIFEDEEE